MAVQPAENPLSRQNIVAFLKDWMIKLSKPTSCHVFLNDVTTGMDFVVRKKLKEQVSEGTAIISDLKEKGRVPFFAATLGNSYSVGLFSTNLGVVYKTQQVEIKIVTGEIRLSSIKYISEIQSLLKEALAASPGQITRDESQSKIILDEDMTEILKQRITSFLRSQEKTTQYSQQVSEKTKQDVSDFYRNLVAKNEGKKLQTRKPQAQPDSDEDDTICSVKTLFNN